MPTPAPRTFVDSPAVREATPLLLGLIGPSGTGKTFSALRLAKGIQRVTGGEIFYIDTEARRALHYAEGFGFKFRHVPFGAPFSPADYLAAFEHCAKRGARVIIADSMSHEHEGPGGVLEMHDDELKRLAGDDEHRRHKLDQLAWQKPKRQRRRLINSLLQMEADFIFCFRAKEKMLLKTGKDPVSLGYMPIAGAEYVFEMTLKCLLLPGADGRPTWVSENPGERMMIKIPEPFRVEPYKSMLKDTVQLSEDVGAAFARWAAGEHVNRIIDIKDLLGKYAACADAATYRLLESDRRIAWDRTSKAEKAALKSAADKAVKRMDEAEGAAGDDKPRGREMGED